MDEPESKRQVEEVYGFSIQDYLESVGKNDVFSIELTTQLRAMITQKDASLAEKDASLAEKDASLAEKDASLAEKDASLAEKDALIHEIVNSRAWKAVMAYRKTLSVLLRRN
jgi:hypothetical protein